MAAPKGNQNAAKGRMWAEAVRKAALNNDKLRKIADKLVDMAVEGDMQAIKEVGDRLDGKTVQAVTGEDGGPLTIEIIRFGNTDSK